VIHNAGVGGSNPLVATIQIKGLPSGRPLLFLGSDYSATTDLRQTESSAHRPSAKTARRTAVHLALLALAD
jgi:hypothetical protein